MTYKLNVRIDLERVNDNGGFSGDRLSVDESLRLEVDGFLEVAQVLGRFHELAENIKAGGSVNAYPYNRVEPAAADVAQAAEPGAPEGLQLDLLCAVVRMEQMRDQGIEHNGVVFDRLLTCDARRLRGYLTPETLAWMEVNEP
ncbi:MAG: hypothetical protein JWP34_5045 [Massilia sp.]|nr:hypothetical protein [Massilia sp.]